MSKAVEDLMHEHEAILFTLRVLDKMAGLAEAGKDPGREDALALIAFLREFADKCHHGKEELILFPALEAAGIRNSGGPIGQMLAEHDAGRALVGGMAAALERPDGFPAFVRAARDYAALLRAHIDKENTVLFPMGEKALGPAALAAVYGRFEEHEEKVIGQGRHEELHAMLDGFEKKYL